MTSHLNAEAFCFFDDLARDNSKAFWTANKSRFDVTIRAPFLQVTEALAADWGGFKVMRMNRDIRFSADKSPYKLMMGAVTRSSGYRYLHFDAEGVMIVAGAYIFDKAQLAGYRERLLDPAGAAQFTALETELAGKGIHPRSGGATPLKSAPRGVDPDHPMIEKLRWKGCMAITRLTPFEATSTDVIAVAVNSFWNETRNFVDWLP